MIGLDGNILLVSFLEKLLNFVCLGDENSLLFVIFGVFVIFYGIVCYEIGGKGIYWFCY